MKKLLVFGSLSIFCALNANIDETLYTWKHLEACREEAMTWKRSYIHYKALLEDAEKTIKTSKDAQEIQTAALDIKLYETAVAIDIIKLQNALSLCRQIANQVAEEIKEIQNKK